MLDDLSDHFSVMHPELQRYSMAFGSRVVWQKKNPWICLYCRRLEFQITKTKPSSLIEIEIILDESKPALA